MVYYEQIDRLKQQYTDKFVVVDESRPELRRFAGQTGVVKTVNMNGRALVQFDAFNNIGWYDIDPAYLRVIDAPLAKPEAKKEKSAPTKVEKPAAPKAEKPSGPAKGGASVADILAAARAGAKTPAAKPASSAATEPAPQAAAAKPAAANPKAMSVADILAAARGKAAPPPSAAKPAPEAKAPAAPPAAPVQAAPPPAPEAPAEPPPVAAPSAPAVSAGGKLSKKDQFATVAEIVAYCQATDRQ